MAEPSLELLQRVIEDIRADLIELKERIGLLEGQSASISRRLDRVSGDVERIKRRSGG